MISIVMPTYNRGHKLRASYEVIDKALEKAKIPFELIVVDDGSSDQTKDYLKELCQHYSNIKGLVLKANYGQQNASLAGIRMSKYPYVVTIDDDLTYDPCGIIVLFNEIQKGYDVVYGLLEHQHEKKFREYGTLFKEFLFFLLLKKPYELRLTSFRIMNRDLADFLSQDQSSNVYLSARTLEYSKNIANVMIPSLTKGDSSHYTVWKLMSLMTNVVLNYTWLKNSNNFSHKKQY
jgi:undecaprenyl-phosphate 4-deoxy-4-formamido-L-arabinose transferase